MSKKTVWIIALVIAIPVVLALVLVLLGALTSLFVMESATENASRSLAEARANELVTAAQIRRMELGPSECPSIAEIASDAFVDASSTTDPWGTEFVIECEGETLRVISAGPDHERGNGDDVVVEDRPAS
jgi:hypothetical protein